MQNSIQIEKPNNKLHRYLQYLGYNTIFKLKESYENNVNQTFTYPGTTICEPKAEIDKSNKSGLESI